METALERWQAEGLPALSLKKPWFGYELGHWTDEEREEAAKQIKDLYRKGLVQESRSPWAAPILMAPKPGGKMRRCVDMRGLNGVTLREVYHLPRIDTLVDELGGKDW